MSVQFSDAEKSMSEALADLHVRLQPYEQASLRQLLAIIGEHGLLVLCILLTIPFLLPITPPGVSSIFGTAILLIGFGVLMNRVPWLPKRIMDHQFKVKDLEPALIRAEQVFAKVETLLKPRLLFLTHGASLNRLNGFMLLLAALLLMVPFGPIPFTNALPALACLLLAMGMLERDGVVIILGYVTVIITLIYFGALIILGLQSGHSLLNQLGGTLIMTGLSLDIGLAFSINHLVPYCL